ncbi:hypothetical protein BCR32DRAFT_263688 [Anaeromyces robustus]|uniref:RIIa domain-containing protein n=1 Tax=Anaeromyces robustus TaxID=1754192 RepID=A0A1Y1XSG8_9FUNG|nr:hypothetical protein BCR32DRAFT_263688 [Anaeromyces robustus]|eukprot:ORX88254.1 hypothetical protein BCR32DRAFT_263688 [Anaeromyces robustus]
MSTTNEEINDNVMKEDENENEIVADITTEQETEPMEVMADNENEVAIEESNDTPEITNKDESVKEDDEKEQEMIPENTEDNQPSQDISNNQDNMMNIDKVEEVNETISSRKSSKHSSNVDIGRNSSKQASSKNLTKTESEHNTGMIDKAFTEPASEQNEMRIYNGPIYCIEQVRIPPELPDIMKNYAKHIIRTQPDDVIIESYEYFKKLNKLRSSTLDDYEETKSKNMSFNKNSDILENSNFSINTENNEGNDKKMTQLTPMELESLYERLLDFSNGKNEIPTSDVRSIAEDANVSQSQVNEAIVVGSWEDEVEWLKFWSLIVAGSCSNLMATLNIIVDIIGDESIIPLDKIIIIAEFLLESDPNADKTIANEVISSLKQRNGDIIEKGDLIEVLSKLKN